MKAVNLFCCLLFLSNCVQCQQFCGNQTVTDTHETDDQLKPNVLNPARGLYLDSLTSAKYFHGLTRDHLRCLTDNHGTNLMLRMYSLDAFADGSPISQEFLKKMQEDFQAAKEAGWSLILRFLYVNNLDTQYDRSKEPSIPQIQAHIRQLSQVIRQYDGVVVAVQAGFHGEYGLWYTPGTNSTQQDTTILATLLQELPTDMPVQVTRPDYKQSLGVTSGRIGHYHECLLGGDTNDLKSAFPDLLTDSNALSYMKTDTGVIGGKTCHPGDTFNPPRNLCTQSETLFKDLHLTYLNGADPDETIKNFERYGCLSSVSNSLGYRLALESVSIPSNTSTNSSACFAIELSNRGYAAPFRHYKVSIALWSLADLSQSYEAPIPTDTTKWTPGQRITLSSSIRIPNNIPAGEYQVYLKIFEPMLDNNTDYFVFLSNSDPNYSSVNGLNKLGKIKITNSGRTTTSQTTSSFSKVTPPPASANPRQWNKVTRSCLQLPNGPPNSGATTSLPVSQVTSNPITTASSLQTITLLPPIVPFTNDTSKFKVCRKIEIVTALLKFLSYSTSSAPSCPNSSSGEGPEAIPILFCDAPTQTVRWRPLGRVIDNCEKIPMFSRVAVFSTLNYYDYDTQVRKCGVFLGCVKKDSKVIGVKIGMQLCGRPFDIEIAKFSNEKDLLNLYVF